MFRVQEEVGAAHVAAVSLRLEDELATCFVRSLLMT